MQPDQPKNYWETTPDQPTDLPVMSDRQAGTYTPPPDDEPTPTPTPTTTPVAAPTAKDEPIHWSADEYIHREKDGLWFTIFGIIAISLIAADIFFLKSYTFSALVVVMAIAVVIYSRRPPKLIDYTLSGDQGLYVGEKLYMFSEFKSFGVINDNNQHMIMLIPTKRFAPSVSVYFPPDVGEKIVDIFGARLPMEQLKLDIIDQIVRKISL